MKLPDNSIGVTDILNYRDCPARMEFGMRRHTEKGEKPEAKGPDNAYGSAVHDMLEAKGNGATDDEAIHHTWKRHGAWLDPEDLDMLREDLQTYEHRDYSGFTVLANEAEIKVPLMQYGGETIYFRGRIDRLYLHPTNPGVGIHIDYKSSKWRKTEEEVHKDLQLWAYNFGIHEFWPEVETLVQRYDQLRYGVETTRKSVDQRRQIKAWLQEQVLAIIEDRDMDPKFNRWCPWCPLLESCGVVRDLTDWSTSRLVALAPSRKIGRKTVMELDPMMIEVYTEQLDSVGTARKVLDRFEKTVREALRELPSDRRHRAGYELGERGADVWTPDALRAAHDVLGDDFYELVKLTKTAIEGHPDQAKVNAVLAMAERVVGSTTIKKAR